MLQNYPFFILRIKEIDEICNKMIQNILVALLVVAATFFIGKRFWDNFRHKKVTAGCAKCDLNPAEKK